MNRSTKIPQNPSRETIAQTYRWLGHASHGVTEVRAISRLRPPLIGYFDNEKAFVEACVEMNPTANVYAGIQPRPRSLADQEPNTMRARPVATKSHEITTLVGTVIDIDPVRPTGTASTEAELAATMEVAQQALPWCRSMGFFPPRRMMSGNGVQLWFALPPIAVTEGNRNQLQAGFRWLESEIRKLATSKVKVDSIHDFPRIIKVIGTWSRKGVPVVDRPHRRSYAIDPLERQEDHVLLNHMLTLFGDTRSLTLVGPAPAKRTEAVHTPPVMRSPVREHPAAAHQTPPVHVAPVPPKPPVPSASELFRMAEKAVSDDRPARTSAPTPIAHASLHETSVESQPQLAAQPDRSDELMDSELEPKSTPENSTPVQPRPVNTMSEQMRMSETGFSTTPRFPETLSHRQEKVFRFVRDPGRLARFEPPVPMCGPFLRLWERGCADRSLALFNMVLYLMHHGMTLPDILPWMIQYDRRVLGKLEGRNAELEIQRCYDKILASRDGGREIAPPCHSLQQLEYCIVHSDVAVRCDLEDNFSNVDRALARIPRTLEQPKLRYRLLPIFREIQKLGVRKANAHAEEISERFSLSPKEADSLLAVAKTLNEVHSLEDSTSRFLGKIYAQHNYYFVDDKNFSGVISSFTLNPTLLVETHEGDVFVVDATTTHDKVIRDLKLPMEAFRSRRDLQEQLQHSQLAWTGKDVHTQGLLNELTRIDVPTRRGVPLVGRHVYKNKAYWVHEEGTITAEGAVTDAPIMHFRMTPSPLATRFSFAPVPDEEVRECAQIFFKHILSLNAPAVVLPTLGWFFAAPVKPFLMRTLHAFPLLFFWGTAGAGKSSMLTGVFWPLAGLKPDETSDSAFSCADTEFAMIQLLSCTNAVPVFLDEYKPEEMSGLKLSQLHKMLRGLYRGEVANRGQRDLSVRSYNLLAPVVMAGETRPREQALAERALIINPDKAALERIPDYRKAYYALRDAQLHRLAGRYVQFTLGRDLRADIEIATRLLDATLERLPHMPIPERVRVNLQVMMLGLYLFEQFAGSLGCQLPQEIDIVSGVRGVLAEILESGEGRVEDGLDRFIKTLAVMAIQGQIEPKTHYMVKDNLLHLHLESCHDAWLKHLREINHKGDAPDLRAMRKLAQEHVSRESYVTSVGELVYFRPGADRRRAVTLDLTRTNVVTAEEFPMMRLE